MRVTRTLTFSTSAVAMCYSMHMRRGLFTQGALGATVILVLLWAGCSTLRSEAPPSPGAGGATAGGASGGAGGSAGGNVGATGGSAPDAATGGAAPGVGGGSGAGGAAGGGKGGAGGASSASDAAAVCPAGQIECEAQCRMPEVPSCPAKGCQLRRLEGAGTCTARCVDDQMQSSCLSGDSCCPAGCALDNDSDCVPPLRMFVTSTKYPGNLGGLTGADARCAERAQAAGLTGTFVAFLSTTTVAAPTRLEGSSGWVRTDGKPFANTVADIKMGKLFFPPRVDEFGKDRPISDLEEAVYTGTTAEGAAFPSNCANWTSSTADSMGGSCNATKNHWLRYWGGGDGSCSNLHRIYCFETGRKATVTPPPTPKDARLAFLAEEFKPTAGLAGADCHCGEAAKSAGLQGEFLAFLATTKASAASRFSLSGPAWVRPDGVPIVATAFDLTTNNLLAPVSVRADGLPYAFGGDVWTGAATPQDRGIATCADWTSANSEGGTAFADFVGPKWFSVSDTDCTIALAIYCFQK